MNKLLPLLLALAAPLATPLIAQGGRTAGGGFTTNSYNPIVFNGIIVQDGKTKVSLYNPTTNDAKWVQVGKKFGNYTVELQPANPNVKNSKDIVILTVGNSRQTVALQDAATLSTNNPAPTAATAITTANNSAAQVEALALRLAEVRNNPNADPATVQAYEQAIARQTQQIMTANGAATGTINITNANGAAIGRTSVRTTLNPDGTRTTVTTNADGSSTSATTPAPQPARTP
jgi:hypothetical protein